VRLARFFLTVDWFSQGFWAVLDVRDGTARVADLRFAETRSTPSAPPAEWGSPFAWSFPAKITPGESVPLLSVASDFGSRRDPFSAIWRRLQGDRSAW
jgi:hypothetical protein